MCEILNKIKLCTCSSDIKELDHYWILHRFEKDRRVIIMGEAMPPSEIDLNLCQKDSFSLLNRTDQFWTSSPLIVSGRRNLGLCGMRLKGLAITLKNLELIIFQRRLTLLLDLIPNNYNSRMDA